MPYPYFCYPCCSPYCPPCCTLYYVPYLVCCNKPCRPCPVPSAPKKVPKLTDFTTGGAPGTNSKKKGKNGKKTVKEKKQGKGGKGGKGGGGGAKNKGGGGGVKKNKGGKGGTKANDGTKNKSGGGGDKKKNGKGGGKAKDGKGGRKVKDDKGVAGAKEKENKGLNQTMKGVVDKPPQGKGPTAFAGKNTDTKKEEPKAKQEKGGSPSPGKTICKCPRPQPVICKCLKPQPKMCTCLKPPPKICTCSKLQSTQPMYSPNLQTPSDAPVRSQLAYGLSVGPQLGNGFPVLRPQVGRGFPGVPRMSPTVQQTYRERPKIYPERTVPYGYTLTKCGTCGSVKFKPRNQETPQDYYSKRNFAIS